MTRQNVSIVLIVVLGALLLAVPALAAALGNPALVGLATRVLIYAIAAASLNLVLGYGGMVSFGHAAFLGVGGYVVGILFHHFRFSEPLFGVIAGSDQLLVVLPAAVLITGILAAGIGALALRTSGVQFIMITLAFAQMLYFFFIALKTYGGDDGLVIRRRSALFDLDMRDDRTFFYVVLGFAVTFFAIYATVIRSRFGLLLGAIRQNESRVAAVGIAPYRYKLAAFVISGMGAGLAGALLANYQRFVSPDMLHWTKSGELMMMVILGGAGTLFGPLFGAAALISLETYLTQWTERWMLILGPVLILIVLFMRGGIAGLIDQLLRRLK